MVWVFGNSNERVLLKDLNDVIYFRQKKQYTDQEFDSSKDLQREIKNGRIVKLEHKPEIKASLPDNIQAEQPPAPKIDLQDIRRIVTEIVKEHKPEELDIKSLMMGMIPLIANTIQEEISKIPAQQVYVSGPGASTTSKSAYQDPAYVPDISSEGFKSNIQIEDTKVEGGGISGSLEALKKLNRSK